MKNIILGLFILIHLTALCQEQTERLENQAMNCIYKSYDDKGVAFKKAINDFEKVLIKENILKDGTGKSYKALFEKIADDNEFSDWPMTNFNDLLIAVGKPQQEALRNCLDTLDKTSINKLETFTNTIQTAKEITPSILANGILDILNEEDFELNYYKMNTFILFDTINYTNDKGLIRKLPEENTQTTFDIDKAIKIRIDGENQFFVNDKKVDLNTLKSKIRSYVSTNKSESYISLSTQRKTNYVTYIEVQNTVSAEIGILRDQLAKKKYNKLFSELTKEQSDEIRKVYPIRLSEEISK